MNNKMKEMTKEVKEMTSIPTMIFGDINREVVNKAKKIGLGDEYIMGDPMNAANLDAIVSPANTVGEMSGGYDLIIRNKLGTIVEDIAMKSLAAEKIYLGQCRVVKSGNGIIPNLMIVPTVVGALVGGDTLAGTLQSKTDPEVIKKAAYNMMFEAYKNGIARFATVLLGGGVGGVDADLALKMMLEGYLEAYDEIDELIYG
jgi:O-acetyl-ADP-ribose deacetylase (regulator of RNase III)